MEEQLEFDFANKMREKNDRDNYVKSVIATGAILGAMSLGLLIDKYVESKNLEDYNRALNKPSINVMGK